MFLPCVPVEFNGNDLKNIRFNPGFNPLAVLYIYLHPSFVIAKYIINIVS